ncbi:MAG: hypothetical protein LUE08_07360 [Akkermansiaceae bacterium]|nr:hypothetical protein [Akkermansiaceae bacterium]
MQADAEELLKAGAWKSREWRLNNLYWIERKDEPPCRFRMNWAQRELFRGLHTRNNILKARQLGMSTLTAMLILDSCLFTENFHAGIIDKTKEDAEEKLRKIRFAVQCMLEPPDGGEAMADRFARLSAGLMKPEITATKANFANGSSIRTGTSLRGGTLQFLHLSEFGHTAANFPQKAREILSGGFNTVAKNGTIIMESTHEGGKFGENYRLTKLAMEKVGKPLTPLDFKFFFFPWWRQPEYSVSSDEPLALGSDLTQYFASLAKDGIPLTDGQKRWYAVQYGIFGSMTKQEYPSTPAEAFEVRVEGAIYGGIITDLRADGRMACLFEADDDKPLYVSWDIGLSDNMAMWLVQPGADGRFYVLDHYTANNHELAHYIAVVRRWEALHHQPIASHLLPHDASKRDLATRTSFHDLFIRQGLPAVIVPRTHDVWAGIDVTRRVLRHSVFHARCSEPVRVDGLEYMSGVNALENYQTAPVGANGVERVQPLHNACSHSADAFRTFAEAYQAGLVGKHSPAAPGRIHASRPLRTGVARGVPWGV